MKLMVNRTSFGAAMAILAVVVTISSPEQARSAEKSGDSDAQAPSILLSNTSRFELASAAARRSGVDTDLAADVPGGLPLAGSSFREDYLTLVAFPAHDAQPLEEPAPAERSSPPIDDEWQFSLAPYLWLTSIRTEVDIGPVSADSEVCFSDLIKQLQLGAQLRFEGVRGPWGFYLDGTYYALGNDAKVEVGPFRIRGIDMDWDFDEAFLDFGGLYRFSEEDWALDLMFGGRYSYVATKLSGPVLLDIDSSLDFVSPFLGVRVRYELSDHWSAAAWGNIGGFGLGDAPDLFWGATVLMDYRYSESVSFGFGYRIYASEFDFGLVNADVQMHGPIIGMAFRF